MCFYRDETRLLLFGTRANMMADPPAGAQDGMRGPGTVCVWAWARCVRPGHSSPLGGYVLTGKAASLARMRLAGHGALVQVVWIQKTESEHRVRAQ